MDEETVIYILREIETSGQRGNHPPPPKLRYRKEGKKKKTKGRKHEQKDPLCVSLWGDTV